MTRSIVRAGADAYVFAQGSKASKNFGNAGILRVRAGGVPDGLESFIRLKSPAPRGATVTSAKIVLTQQGAGGGGSKTVTAGLCSADFQERKVTWNNRPGSTGNVNTSRTAADDAKWEIDVTAAYQSYANGVVNRGIRLSTSSTTELRFHGLQAASKRPYLEVIWSTRPDKPEALVPSFAAVSLAKWTQSCDYIDRSGADSIAAVRVQIDSSGSEFVTGMWDSGEVLAEAPALDLALTSYPGLAVDASAAVRMAVKDDTGLWSFWSDAVTITRRSKPTLTITAPSAAASKVYEFTPPIGWSYAAGSGGAQTHWRVTIHPASDLRRVLHDSGKNKGTDNSYTLPGGVLRDDSSYVARVYVWDSVPRERSTADAVYVMAQQAFTVDYDPLVAAPTTVVVDNAGTRPWVDITITRAASPDSWTVQRAGDSVPGAPGDTGAMWQLISADRDPVDQMIGPTTWRIRDWTARQGLPYTYRVRAEVNGKLSPGVDATITPSGVGIWLLDPRFPSASQVVLGERNFQMTADDNATAYQPLGGLETVRTVMGLTGMTGSVDNLMIRDRPDYGLTWKQVEDRLYELKSRPTDEFRLVLGDLNIPVVLGDLVIAPHPQSTAALVLKTVSFKFWQSGEHRYTSGV